MCCLQNLEKKLKVNVNDAKKFIFCPLPLCRVLKTCQNMVTWSFKMLFIDPWWRWWVGSGMSSAPTSSLQETIQKTIYWIMILISFTGHFYNNLDWYQSFKIIQSFKFKNQNIFWEVQRCLKFMNKFSKILWHSPFDKSKLKK